MRKRKNKEGIRLVRRVVPGSSDVAHIAGAVAAVLGTRGAVHRGSNSDMGEPRCFWPSGVPELDGVLDRKKRGWPAGRVIEVYGGPGTVKTGLGYALIAAVQARGGVGVLYPAEGNVDLWLLRRYKINPQQLIVVEPEVVAAPNGAGEVAGMTVEQFTEGVAASLRADPNLPMVHVLDSVAGLLTREELLALALGVPMKRDRTAQVRALLLSATMRRFGAWIPKTSSTLFLINQTRDDPDVTYGPKSKPPGGKAIKFHASIRLELTIIGKWFAQTEGKKRIVGFNIVATSEKNRLAAPFQEGKFRLHFDRGLLPMVSTKAKSKSKAGKPATRKRRK